MTTGELNPYAPPTEAYHADRNSTSMYVDGKYLVVRSNVTLPPRCVFTNQPIQEHEYHSCSLVGYPRRRFAWCSAKCAIRFGVHHSLSRREWWTLVVVHGLIFVGLGLVSILIRFDDLWMLATFGLVMGHTIYVWRPGDLRIRDYKDGWFWIQGCSDSFLAQLENEVPSN
jgi:hypothetical protein